MIEERIVTLKPAGRLALYVGIGATGDHHHVAAPRSHRRLHHQVVLAHARRATHSHRTWTRSVYCQHMNYIVYILTFKKVFCSVTVPFLASLLPDVTERSRRSRGARAEAPTTDLQRSPLVWTISSLLRRS